MAQQDLTPQLRTRLNRVERAVGIFVTFATVVLLAGFGYYVFHVAKRKGWFLTKVTYETGVNNAAGLAVGNPVKLMGFNVGEITAIIPNDPYAGYGVTVRFQVRDPNYGYIWTDSKVRVAPADFLGNRYLEILKGKEGTATVVEKGKAVGVLSTTVYQSKFDEHFKVALSEAKTENPDYPEHALRAEATNTVQAAINEEAKNNFENYYVERSKVQKPYWLEPLESPAVTERLEAVVNTLETALPNVLKLTNQLAGLLNNANTTVSQVNSFVADARPIVTNLSTITANLREPKGALGEWLLPTNLNTQLQTTLVSAESTLNTANTTLRNTDAKITTLVSNLDRSLENLANLTSNLNAQVQVNTNILGEISQTIIHTDDLVQGLKRHWLLRSAFKTNKTQKAVSPYPGRRDAPAIPRLKK